MSEIAIRAEGLSKLFHIGQSRPFRSLRDSLGRMLRFGKAEDHVIPATGATAANGSDETIWALKDVSFEIKRGEVVGIIGRNGAGKSTLLKILSRITEPTQGHADIHGRVGSLLEVGTGFHPELSGRENIFLNGAILGMARTEIKKKFDEIVDFAEVAKFIDTPVKHYSSGMYMRLAFAVAAHLEPEILVVDEVLAVGDSAFQQKCLGKMGQVARQGRTVLFVSHNLGSITHLCTRAFLLKSGTLCLDASPREAVDRYTQPDTALRKAGEVIASDATRSFELADVTFADSAGRVVDRLCSGQAVDLRLHVRTIADVENCTVTVGIADQTGNRVALLSTGLTASPLSIRSPQTTITVNISELCLSPGEYRLSIKFIDVVGVKLWAPDCVTLSVEPGDFFGTGKMIGASWLGTTLLHQSWSAAAQPAPARAELNTAVIASAR